VDIYAALVKGELDITKSVRDSSSRRGAPALRISDQALRAMVSTPRPATVRELLAIPGIGITTVEKYARQFNGILQKGGS
jgi:HRDC domain-containing protein